MIRVLLSALILTLLASAPSAATAAPKPAYPAVKAAIGALQIEQFSEPLSPYGKAKFRSDCWARSGCLAFGACDLLDNYLPEKESGTRAARYAVVANVAVIYERALTKLGYPRSVWVDTIRRFEAYEVSRADHDASGDRADRYRLAQEPYHGVLGEQLTTEMRAYQARHPNLHGLVAEGGCGGGEIAVKIVTSPLATQTFIIPSFYFEVCRAQGVRPEDFNACGHWREVLAPVEQISGSYHYFVRWSDGVTRRGLLNANDFTNGELTLRKP